MPAGVGWAHKCPACLLRCAPCPPFLQLVVESDCESEDDAEEQDEEAGSDAPQQQQQQAPGGQLQQLQQAPGGQQPTQQEQQEQVREGSCDENDAGAPNGSTGEPALCLL